MKKSIKTIGIIAIMVTILTDLEEKSNNII